MYKLQYMNITIETDSEARKNELISIGYEFVDEVENSNMSTTDATNENSENEISQEVDISEEQSEDSVDGTEENKAGKKSGKAKK